MKNTEKIKTLQQLNAVEKEYRDEQEKYQYRVYVCAGAGCISSNCGAVRDAIIVRWSGWALRIRSACTRRAAWARARLGR